MSERLDGGISHPLQSTDVVNAAIELSCRWTDTNSRCATQVVAHDRLLLARSQMERALRGRRATSRLPASIKLVLSRPDVSMSMIQEQLKVSRQGALDLIGAFNLRELIGRRSFRAWGIL